MITDRKYKIEGCFMDDNKKFAFIHIYKNASISMRNILGIRGKYNKFSNVKKYNPITLCIIRNPIDRIISAYQYILRLEDNNLPDQHPIEITRNTNFYKEKNDYIYSFKLFIDYILNNGFYDAVTLPQSDFLKDRKLKIEDIDEIFNQSNIDKDFEIFKNKYNLGIGNLPKDNIGNKEIANDIKVFILKDRNIYNIIYKLYKSDFEIFNYINNK